MALKIDNNVSKEVHPSLRVMMGKGDNSRQVAGVVQIYE